MSSTRRHNRLWCVLAPLACFLMGCETGQQGVRVNLTAALRYYREHNDRRPTREQMQQVVAQLSAEQLNDMGVIYEREGRLEEAAWAYQHAIWAQPQFAMAYVNLGNVLRQQGKMEEARWRYRQALSADPSNLLAANNLGDLCASEQVDMTEACVRLEPLVTQSGPYQAYGLDTLGWLYHLQDCDSKALPYLTQALQKAEATDIPLLVSIHGHMADALQASGASEEAAQQRKEVERLSAALQLPAAPKTKE